MSRQDTHTVVVTIVHGRHDHLARQSAYLTAHHPDVQHVVVAMADPGAGGVVDDAATVVQMECSSDQLPLAAARNLGVEEARRQQPDLLVLLDVDCVIGPGCITAYRSAAARYPKALLCGAVTYLPPEAELPLSGPTLTNADSLSHWYHPHPARPAPAPGTILAGGDHNLFWSLNFALTPAVWDRIGGFSEEYTGYGGEDTDFAWQARRNSVDLVWVGGADAFHQWHPVSSPPVEHTRDIVRNACIFHGRWGHWPMQGWLRELTDMGRIRWVGGRPVAAS